jgi:hypothetical protein
MCSKHETILDLTYKHNEGSLHRLNHVTGGGNEPENTNINEYPCSGSHFGKKYAFNIVPVP